MEPVVTVNLAGNAYQLETSAHQALKAYLDRAGAALADNPDKAEIIRDLEQAVADKASAYLSAYKSVIGGQDMDAILAELGPVEDESGAAPEADSNAEDAQAGAPRKRLFRVREGAVISGVCSGLGAYFAIDANIIRFAFVIAAIFTHGLAILIYVAMMFLIPSAHTSAEWAAAHGLPSTAQEVIDQAKRNFAEFTGPGGAPWRWRRESRRAWRQEMRARARVWARSAPPPSQPSSGPFSFIARIFGGLFLIVFSIISVALLIAFLAAMFSLISSGAVLGWSLPSSVPMWVGIVGLAMLYGALAGPLGALQQSSQSALTGAPHVVHHHGGGAVSLIVLVLAGWFAYTQFPEAKAWMDFMFTQMRVWFESLAITR